MYIPSLVERQLEWILIMLVRTKVYVGIHDERVQQYPADLER
jgi:hypothetical protein